MDFVTGLPLSVNWKGNSYNSILVIVNSWIKMVHYKPVKVTINAPGLAEVIIDVVVQYYDLPDSIISERVAIFMSQFCFLLCAFFIVKKKLSIAFYRQTNNQTK